MDSSDRRRLFWKPENLAELDDNYGKTDDIRVEIHDRMIVVSDGRGWQVISSESPLIVQTSGGGLVVERDGSVRRSAD